MTPKARFSIALMAFIVVFFVVQFVVLRGKPIPADKADYVGEWTAPNVRLFIPRNGNLEYERRDGDTKKSLNLPIKGFKGNDVSAGFLFLSTTFVVSKPPYREGDKWKMVVDGIELTRSDTGQF